MVRNKLAAATRDRASGPNGGPPPSQRGSPRLLERVGYLVSRGHLTAEDFWNDARPVVGFYWGVLSPYIEHDRAAGRSSIYRWFEWLELEMRRIDVKRTGRAVVFDAANRASEIADRIAIFRLLMLRDSEGWSGPFPRTTSRVRGLSRPRPFRSPGITEWSRDSNVQLESCRRDSSRPETTNRPDPRRSSRYRINAPGV